MGELLSADATGDSSESSLASVLVLGSYRRQFPGGCLPLVVEARGVVGRDVGVDRGPRFPGPTIPLWRRGFCEH